MKVNHTFGRQFCQSKEPRGRQSRKSAPQIVQDIREILASSSKDDLDSALVLDERISGTNLNLRWIKIASDVSST